MMAAADKLKTMEEDDEVRRVQLEAARLRAEYAQALESARQSGADYGEVEEEYQQRINDMDSLAKTTKGRQAAALAQAGQRKEFFDSVNRAKLSRAVEQSSQEMVEYLNIAAAGITADPSQVEAYKANLQNIVNAYSGLSPEQKKRLYMEGAAILDEGAAKAWLAIDPQFTLDNLKTGKWADLPADTRVAMVAQAKDKIQQEEMRKRTDIVWSENRRNERGRLAYRDSLRQLAFPEDEGSRKLALDSAEHNMDLSAEQVKALYAFDKALQDDHRKPTVSNPTVVRHLYGSIAAPYGSSRKMVDADDIASAFVLGEISRVDHDWLQKIFDMDMDPKGRAFMETAKPHLESVASHIGKSTLGSPDPAGDELYARFLKRFYDEVDTLREAEEDPRQLLNPDAPNYIMNWREAAKRGMGAVMRAKLAELGVDPRGVFNQITAEDQETLTEVTGPDDPKMETIKPGQVFMYKRVPYRRPLGAPE